jgi:hypothetical protein
LQETLNRKVAIANDAPPWPDGASEIRVADAEHPPLMLDAAYRATYHFIAQYYGCERITPLFRMLCSMDLEPGDDPRRTSDPATWEDWLASARVARASLTLPPLPPPHDGR